MSARRGRPPKGPDAPLEPREDECLRLIRASEMRGGISMAELSEAMGCARSTAETYAHRLRQRDLVHSIGWRSASVWLPTVYAATCSVPAAYERQTPSVFHLGAML